MLSSLANAFKIPDLRKKIFYTAALLMVYRLGSFIPVPNFDAGIMSKVIGEASGVFGLLDMFAGGALSRLSVFALGVGPYITASIVMQMLQILIPKLQEMAKESVEGRKKLQQYTRYATMGLAVIQAYAYIMWGYNVNAILNPGILTTMLIIVTMTAGTAFLMWLGEKISELGIGNGISLIIFAGIVARLPFDARRIVTLLGAGGIGILQTLSFLLIALAATVGIIWIQQGQRKIPVQYAKRVVGRKMYGGQSTHIPLKVNQPGVIPIIFASSILAFPITLASFVPALQPVVKYIGYGTIPYLVVYALMVVFFTYFYTAVTFQPVEIANNMKKYGGFIPGIRPGRPTAEYLDRIMTRITLAGAVFLAGVAILPNIITALTKIDMSMGGTGLLIVVGVALDTMKQIESQLLMRQYEGFIK